MLDTIISINLITKTNRINPNIDKILEKHPDVRQKIINFTNFLTGDNITIQERVFVIFQQITHQPVCSTCSNALRFDRGKKKFLQYCSTKCMANNSELSEQKKEKWKQKQESTIKKIKKTKRSHTKEVKKEIQEKRNSTIKEKYGDINPWKDGDAAEKRKRTNLEKFQVEHASQNINIRKKIKDNHAKTIHNDKLNNTNVLTEMNHTDKMSLSEISNHFQVSKHAVWTRFQQGNIKVQHHFSSIPQQKIERLLSDMQIPFESNNRSVLTRRKELDIYIPRFKLAIEINGSYWHSELNGKDRNYHITKTRECEVNDIQLLHFLDLEILHQWDVVCSMIKHKINKTPRKIYGRNCSLVSISPQEGKDFCDKNHIQRGIFGKYNYGLIYNDKLVAVLVSSKSRFEPNKIEILRFCSIFDSSVIGAFGKLLAGLIHDVDMPITTYSDNRFGTGQVYESLGFTKKHQTPPNYFYFNRSDPSVLLSRIKFQKHKLPNLFENVNMDLSEWEIMKSHNFDRIWDCGSTKWVLE